MNILVAVNDNYVYPLLVMLESLYKTNTWEPIKVYLLYSNLTKKHIRMIEKITTINSNSLSAIYVKEDVECLPARGFSAETYYRLFAFKYLPSDVDRILFLDPDMIVCDSLKSIYEKQFHNFFVYAVPDKEDDQIKKTRKVFSIDKKYKYVNSGFQLMNIKEIRNQVSYMELNRFILNNADRLPYLDQDVLNILFMDKIGYIDEKYNFDCRFHINTALEKVQYLIEKYLLSFKNDKVVLHYKGKSKPWNKGYTGKYQNYFLKYAKLVKPELKRKI